MVRIVLLFGRKRKEKEKKREKKEKKKKKKKKITTSILNQGTKLQTNTDNHKNNCNDYIQLPFFTFHTFLMFLVSPSCFFCQNLPTRNCIPIEYAYFNASSTT